MKLFNWYIFPDNIHPIMPIYYDNGYVCIQLLKLQKNKIRITRTVLESYIQTEVELAAKNRFESIICIFTDDVYLKRT